MSKPNTIRGTFRGLLTLASLCAATVAAPALGQPQPAPSSGAPGEQPTAAEAPQIPPEQETQGKQLAGEGFAAYQKSDYATALQKFEQARKIYPTGQVLRMTGYTLLALKRWLEASEALDAALATKLKPLDAKDTNAVQDNLTKAWAHLGTVAVTSKVAGAKAIVDDGDPRELPAEIRLAEGSHRLVVFAQGYKDAEQSVDLPAGKKIDLEIDPTKLEVEKKPPVEPPKPPPEQEEQPGQAWFPHQRLIGAIVGGTGLAIGVAGIATLASGASLRGAVQDNIDAHNDSFGDQCAHGNYALCNYDIQLINHDGERAQTMTRWGLGLSISGGVLLAAGAVFFFTAPWDDGESAAGPEPGANPEAPKSDGPPEQARVGCGPFGLGGIGCAGSF
jgi:hypothetical protein